MKDMLAKRGLAQEPVDPIGSVSNKLRELYDSIQSEGIPDKFLDLLEKLDEAEKAAEK